MMADFIRFFVAFGLLAEALRDEFITQGGPTSYDQRGTKYSCGNGCSNYDRTKRCFDKYTGKCKIEQCSQVVMCPDWDTKRCQDANLVKSPKFSNKLGSCLKQFTSVEMNRFAWDPVGFPAWTRLSFSKDRRETDSSWQLRSLWQGFCSKASCSTGGKEALQHCQWAKQKLQDDFCDESCALFSGVLVKYIGDDPQIQKIQRELDGSLPSNLDRAYTNIVKTMEVRIQEEDERKKLEAEAAANREKFEWKGYSNPLTDNSIANYHDAIERGMWKDQQSKDGFDIQRQNALNQVSESCKSECARAVQRNVPQYSVFFETKIDVDLILIKEKKKYPWLITAFTVHDTSDLSLPIQHLQACS